MLYRQCAHWAASQLCSHPCRPKSAGETARASTHSALLSPFCHRERVATHQSHNPQRVSFPFVIFPRKSPDHAPDSGELLASTSTHSLTNTYGRVMVWFKPFTLGPTSGTQCFLRRLSQSSLFAAQLFIISARFSPAPTSHFCLRHEQRYRQLSALNQPLDFNIKPSFLELPHADSSTSPTRPMHPRAALRRRSGTLHRQPRARR